jgi:hypothetical protein
MHTVKIHVAVDMHCNSFVNLTPVGGEWSASGCGYFIYRDKTPQYPVNRGLGGLQSWSGHFVTELSELNKILSLLFFHYKWK